MRKKSLEEWDSPLLVPALPLWPWPLSRWPSWILPTVTTPPHRRLPLRPPSASWGFLCPWLHMLGDHVPRAASRSHACHRDRRRHLCRTCLWRGGRTDLHLWLRCREHQLCEHEPLGPRIAPGTSSGRRRRLPPSTSGSSRWSPPQATTGSCGARPPCLSSACCSSTSSHSCPARRSSWRASRSGPTVARQLSTAAALAYHA